LDELEAHLLKKKYTLKLAKMRIEFKLVLGEFTNDIGFTSHANAFFEELSLKYPEFKYHKNIEDINIVIADTTFSIMKTVFIPDFNALITRFSNNGQTKQFILNGIKTFFKTKNSNAGFRNGNFDSLSDYISSGIFN